MPHELELIATISAALGLALIMGFVAVRVFKLPALVGYLIAGILIGPATPGFVADVHLSQQLAEIGVMLLMFGVGLHFSLDDLLSVKGIALPGAIVQIGVATAMGAGLAAWWGWPLSAGLVFGLALSVASTVVLLRALEDRGLLETVNGRIAVGWLVVEDLVMVLALVLLPALAGLSGNDHASTQEAARPLWLALAITLGKVTVFVVLMLVGGRKLFPWLLWQVARTGSRELFTLCVIAAAVGIAFAAGKLFDVSFALGAFLAGMVLRESELSYRAAEESLPLRDAFAVLFFVSVGMLFDPRILVDAPWMVAAVVGVIVLGKSIAAAILVLLLRYPLNTALTVSASLAQIGEFSFIIAALGVSLNLLPAQGQSLILAGAIISIALNPLVFGAIEPAQAWIRERSGRARGRERPADPLAELPTEVSAECLTGHVVLVGHGRVGRAIAAALRERGLHLVVADANRARVGELRQNGLNAVTGDASEPAVLVQAHVMRARLLVIAIPDTFHVRRMIETARALNPRIHIVVRSHSEEDTALLQGEGDTVVFSGERTLALAMVDHVLAKAGPAPARD